MKKRKKYTKQARVNTKMKFLISLLMIGSMLLYPIQTLASSEKIQNSSQININVTLDELKDGITVLLRFNSDGTCTETVFDKLDDVPQLTKVSDGKLEWAVFHLGFRNWSGKRGDLYYDIEADEALDRVRGRAYVKSVSVFGSTYYNDSFSKNLSGSHRSSSTIKEDINVGNSKEVLVGYSGVTFTTKAGAGGSFQSKSKIVKK